MATHSINKLIAYKDILISFTSNTLKLWTLDGVCNLSLDVYATEINNEIFIVFLYPDFQVEVWNYIQFR